MLLIMQMVLEVLLLQLLLLLLLQALLLQDQLAVDMRVIVRCCCRSLLRLRWQFAMCWSGWR